MEPRKSTQGNEESENSNSEVEMLSGNRNQMLDDLAKNRLYTSEDVCKILNISIPSLRRAIKLGRVKTIYVGRFLRITAEEVERLIGSQNTLSVKEAANLLNVGVTAVRNLIKEGSIKALRLADKGPWRIPFEEIEKFTKGVK
ncbi:MAG: helix-turn-helix domain-containing protein [Chlamydiales bacterium]|nr:helix-turn-helix domain-containing protein [Chlamydiales bacterium]